MARKAAPVATPSARLDKAQRLKIYYHLKQTRMLEEKLSALYKQNKIIGGLYRSLGQEGTSVGSAFALQPQDVICPMIRNMGSLLVKGAQPRHVFAQYMARDLGPSHGRDNGVHFGDIKQGTVSIISHLGAMIPIMVGIGLASKLKRLSAVALNYIGDGGTSTGDFHEALNLASVQRIPFVLIAEHNQFAYSTPTEKQMNVGDIAERAKGYGIPGPIVDGNDTLAVYDVTMEAVERARRGEGPTLIEVKTMRMLGHAEHDDFRYVPRELIEEWRAKDPIERYERQLLDEGLATPAELQAMVARIDEELDAARAEAEASPLPPGLTVHDGVYADGGPGIERWRRPWD
ncbi:MAG: thiamine pyrophosphate-dependent dehydrogenase E1 component subunit alpha [Candidatus Xenobia bacterium]